MKIDADCANCAPWRDLRCFGRRENLLVGKMIDISEEKEDFSENEEKGRSPKESKSDFEHIPGRS